MFFQNVRMIQYKKCSSFNDTRHKEIVSELTSLTIKGEEIRKTICGEGNSGEINGSITKEILYSSFSGMIYTSVQEVNIYIHLGYF